MLRREIFTSLPNRNYKQKQLLFGRDTYKRDLKSRCRNFKLFPKREKYKKKTKLEIKSNNLWKTFDVTFFLVSTHKRKNV